MANLAQLFADLLPPRVLYVGDVLSVDDGQVVIELPGGGRIRARGEALVGDRVYVRDGVIEGPAPDLPVDVIEV